MTKEITFPIIIAVLGMAFGFLEVILPPIKNKWAIITSCFCTALIVVLAIIYYEGVIPSEYGAYLIPAVLVLLIIPIAVLIFVFIIDKNKSANELSKENSVLTKEDKKYIARANKEFQNINDYFKSTIDNIDIKNISKSKIQKMDGEFFNLLGLRTIKYSKPPKLLERILAFYILFYNLFRAEYLMIKAQVNTTYRLNLFFALALVPDRVGIGLSLYDKKSERLTQRLLRTVGERVTSNTTITVILDNKKYCYAANNFYFWSLTYKKGHPKIPLNHRMLIQRMYEFSEGIPAYAFTNVNKAITSELVSMNKR